MGICNTIARDGAITIHWEPIECRHRNGEIVGYKVIYYPSSDMSMSESVEVTETSHTFSATGLMCNTEYVFQVQAISRDNGTGPPTSITINTLLLEGQQFIN